MLGLSSNPFPSGVHTETPYAFLVSHLHCHMPRPYHSCRLDNPNIIWWGVPILKLLIVQFSPVSCYFFAIRPKYRSEHPVVEHSGPLFFPQCDRQSATPISNNGQFSSLYFSVANGKTTIPNRTVTAVPWIFSALNLFVYAVVIS
jgi:hypothetical protein